MVVKKEIDYLLKERFSKRKKRQPEKSKQGINLSNVANAIVKDYHDTHGEE